jgi:formate dehydrogenase major subunit
MTYRTEGIREKTPCTFVEVSPDLAGERGIQTGSWVQLTSRYGKVKRTGRHHDKSAGKRAVYAHELYGRGS